ncbi:MAG: FG-GAP-like repeat-containing protein [Acidobacteriota bacterium]
MLLIPGVMALIAVATAFAFQSAELQTLRNQGKARFEEQDFAGAVAAFAQAAVQQGAGAQDYINLAAAEYRDGDDPAALATLDRYDDALGDHPGDPFLRGLIARRAGDLDGARAAFEAARALDPTDPAIRFHLGAVYAQMGLQGEALAEFQAVIDMGFDVGVQHYVSSVYQYMQILLRQGRRQEAQPYVDIYREANGRLTQAARAPGALDLSRWSAITVPTATVQPATPDTVSGVRFEDSTSITVTGDGGVAVADLDLDGRQDWAQSGPQGAIWLATDGGYEPLAWASPVGPVGVGDYDRDGRPDIYVAAAGGDRLYRNVAGDAAGAPTFEQVDAEGLPSGGSPSSVLWVDFDHDGDLDVLITHGAADGTPGTARLLLNQGSDVFADATATAGSDAPRADTGTLFADFDADFDVDLLFWGADGTTLYTNLRNGLFDEITAAVGARVDAPVADVVAEDLDNDGLVDMALATAGGIELRRNLPQGTFLPAASDVLAGVAADHLAAADFNNDGYLDLVASTDDGLRFWANAGDLRFEPFDPPAAGAVAPRRLVAADADGNGAVDLMIAGGDELKLLAQPAPPADWLSIALHGEKNNLQGVGATVEVKAGGSYQLRPLRRTPLHFGVGDHAQVEVVRIRWPNGIIQNLLDAATGERHDITELERLEGSCPFLYSWDGERFQFVNEVLGSSPLGMLLAQNVYFQPDGDEYVFVRGDQLRERDGYYELRLTEELRETSYIDALRVLTVDHPAEYSMRPDEGFGGAQRPPFRVNLYGELSPVRVTDQDGRDWTAQLAAVDGDWAVPFAPGRYDGLATEHTLTLELPEARATAGEAGATGAEGSGTAGSPPVKLYLTGWVYWSMGSVNLAVDQDPATEFLPVSLEVPDGNGGWRTAIDDIGLPISKNSTLVVDISDVIDRADPRVRLRTTMRLYWDAMAYAVGGEYAGGVQPAGDWQEAFGVPRAGTIAMIAPDGSAAPLRVEAIAPASAELRARGFSAAHRTPEGFETFDYQDARPDAPWEQHRGYFTRFGDVNELLQAADDRYVVLATGDEIALRFAAPDAPLPDGWQRDYLVYLNGWLKDTDVNSMYGDRVGPLPFQEMSSYPYPPSESYPDDDEHSAFLERYLTRPPRPINPPLRGGR